MSAQDFTASPDQDFVASVTRDRGGSIPPPPGHVVQRMFSYGQNAAFTTGGDWSFGTYGAFPLIQDYLSSLEFGGGTGVLSNVSGVSFSGISVFSRAPFINPPSSAIWYDGPAAATVTFQEVMPPGNYQIDCGAGYVHSSGSFSLDAVAINGPNAGTVVNIFAGGMAFADSIQGGNQDYETSKNKSYVFNSRDVFGGGYWSIRLTTSVSFDMSYFVWSTATSNGAGLPPTGFAWGGTDGFGNPNAYIFFGYSGHQPAFYGLGIAGSKLP